MSRTTTNTARARPDGSRTHWRTVDILVAAVIAVTGGVVFWAWDQMWTWSTPAFAGFPPAQAVLYGIWLAPGVLAGLVLRKPGAAVFTEFLAGSVSALLGTKYGLSTVVYGFFEGLAPELVFALVLYRVWRLPVALAAAAAAGVAAAVLDLWVYDYYAGIFSAQDDRWYLVIVVASCLLVAGIGAWALTRSLARTGVLSPFASGRAQRAV